MSNDQRGKPGGWEPHPQGAPHQPQQQGHHPGAAQLPPSQPGAPQHVGYGSPQMPAPQPGHHGPPQMPAPPHGWQPPHGAQAQPPQGAHAQPPHGAHARPPHAPQPYGAPHHGAQPPYGASAQAPYGGQPAMHGAPLPGWQPPHGQAPLPAAIANQPGHHPQVPAEAGMFKRSLGRAFRLRIEPDEVSPRERAALLASSPPITVPYLQAFLAWRRSVLFLVAVALVPLTLLRLADALSDDMPDELKFLVVIPAAAEAFLCLVCWYQLKNWTHWRQQRRALMKAWVVFMAAPFLVFLVPIDSVLQGMVNTAPVTDEWGAQAMDSQAAAGTIAVMKTVVAVYALLTLAPKAVSLVAGTVRAGIVTKMLFPGTSGPGWIVVLATPLYALFVFTLLIVPYQLTGSGWFMGAMIALAVAQASIGRAGYRLAKPMTHDESVGVVRKARGVYLIAMASFAVCVLVALAPLADKLGAGMVVTTALSFQTNVMLLTLIGSDLVITSLARSRGLSSGTTHLVDESNQQLAAFVGEG
ncbi:MAG: hypothetical protein SFX73_10780 [Kofleriaceae bacterium]|nr:hypothetical protein [Kofleriaceae bacterium]